MGSENKALPENMDPVPSLEVRSGDLLMSRASGSRDLVGSVALVPECRPRLLLCDKIFRLQIEACTAHKPFLAYAMNSRIARWQIEVVLSGGSGLANNIAQGVVKDLVIAAPTRDEQLSIAAFLDVETARIDALVVKKEKLIELLQEKRAALITRAVTRGLDPNAPMRNSGVEWLGEIPTHWKLVPSTWLFTESKQRALDGDQQLSATQRYGVIPQAEFERLEGRQVVHAFLHLDRRKHVEVEDFVMSMRSFEGGLERVRARGCVRSSYVVLRSSAQGYVGFFSYLFKSSAYVQALRATSNFIRDGQDLNFENFRLVRLPLVPLREQEIIAAFLDRETVRLDALTAKVREAIERLRELRTALITAAVTGKIDVRGEAA